MLMVTYVWCGCLGSSIVLADSRFVIVLQLPLDRGFACVVMF